MARAPNILSNSAKETMTTEAILEKIKTPLSAFNR